MSRGGLFGVRFRGHGRVFLGRSRRYELRDDIKYMLFELTRGLEDGFEVVSEHVKMSTFFNDVQD